MLVNVLVFPAMSLALTFKGLSPNVKGTSINLNLPAPSAVVEICVPCNVTVAFASVCPIRLTFSKVV